MTLNNSAKLNKYITQLADIAVQNTNIDPELYKIHDVKRGLRDVNGKGVPAGLTEISDIISFRVDKDGVEKPIPGELYYRGIDINEIVDGSLTSKTHAFEEATYLLLFGELPTRKQLNDFESLLKILRELPSSFVRDVIMKAPSDDMMNALGRSVLTLYSYDSDPDNIEIKNVLRQCLKLIAQFPLIAVYGYQVHQYYKQSQSLIIHQPDDSVGTAGNILHLLRPDSKYTELEERLLDLLLLIHAEHGGGNNSTYTTHLVTSTLTDTYSCMAASLGSLKGPRHGGANIKVVEMFNDIRRNVKNQSDGEIADYLNKILNKQAYDRSGLIYGMGHAVYSISDPRAKIIQKYVELLAKEKKRNEEYELYKKIERLAPEVIEANRKTYKNVSANVDFFSGFAYSMLDIPIELYTPLFAVSRISGWSAHRIEELANGSKIIRPGYIAIKEHRPYTPLDLRK